MANINTQVDNIKKARKIIDYAKIENNEIEPVEDWGGFSTETLWFILSELNPEENNKNSLNSFNDNTNSSENENLSSLEGDEENSLNPSNDSDFIEEE